MIDAQKINTLLHSSQSNQLYKARVGEYIKIVLPRIPMTRYTEFVQLEKEKWGDLNCFVEEQAPDVGEGSLLPRQIFGRAVRPGKLHIVLSAKDILSGQKIPGVEPLNILVEVQDDK
jgi:hypothetical protein